MTIGLPIVTRLFIHVVIYFDHFSEMFQGSVIIHDSMNKAGATLSPMF